jgi:TPR repeat protein
MALAALLLSGGTAAADFDEGVAYYDKGDFFRALSELKPEAEAGNAIAQVYVAGIYQYGLVSAINYAEAFKWYERAARQDNVDGQIGLGVLYSLGQGVEENPVEAYKWLRIAADRLPQGSDRSRIIGALDAIAESMTQDEVAEAKQLAKAWQPGP